MIKNYENGYLNQLLATDQDPPLFKKQLPKMHKVMTMISYLKNFSCFKLLKKNEVMGKDIGGGFLNWETVLSHLRSHEDLMYRLFLVDFMRLYMTFLEKNMKPLNPLEVRRSFLNFKKSAMQLSLSRTFDGPRAK